VWRLFAAQRALSECPPDTKSPSSDDPVYAALAWYYDHQTEMDAEIARQDERVQALREAAPPSPLQRRLAASRRGK
jgi:hypothetical protein